MSSPRTRASATSDRSQSGWVTGMTTFAAYAMIIIGLFQGIAGITALFQNNIYVAGSQYLFSFDVTAWGWIHLLLGVLVFVTGFALLQGGMPWARPVGIGLVALSALGNFMSIPHYPIWSIVIIALDVIVIWALCVYNPDAVRS